MSPTARWTSPPLLTLPLAPPLPPLRLPCALLTLPRLSPLSDGQITLWLPPDGDDFALWRMEHYDGDEEDLEEYEVCLASRDSCPHASSADLSPPSPSQVTFAMEAYQQALETPSEQERAKVLEEQAKAKEEDDEDAEDDDDDAGKGATAPMDEDEDDESEDEDEGEGGADAPSTVAADTLWRSTEARARWLGAMGAAHSAHTLALGLASLKMHCQLFAPLQDRKLPPAKRAELAAAIGCFYHGGAFGKQSFGAKPTPKPKGGGADKGGSVRSSNAELPSGSFLFLLIPSDSL